MHGDTVVGLFGQLVKSHDGVLVDAAVFGLEVVDERRHSTGLAERRPVAAPHAAAADGLGQVAEESVVSLTGETAWTRSTDEPLTRYDTRFF